MSEPSRKGQGFAGLAGLVSELGAPASTDAGAPKKKPGPPATRIYQGASRPSFRAWPRRREAGVLVLLLLAPFTMMSLSFLNPPSDDPEDRMRELLAPVPIRRPPPVPKADPAAREEPGTVPVLQRMPPPGQDLLLSVEQIQYCLAEEIRLDRAKTVVDSYDSAMVDRFNGMIRDYNSRCGSFQYRRMNAELDTLETARLNIEPYRLLLGREGIARFAKPEKRRRGRKKP